MFSVKGLAAALFVVCAGVGLSEGLPQGRIELIGTNLVSFGTYPNTEERTARVQVRNVGRGPLRIERVITTCKCMRVVDFVKELSPGQTGEVAVAINKNELAGPYKRIFIIDSDDPVVRSVWVHIEGVAKPLFMVTCDKETSLGPVDPGLVWTGRYTVAATEAGVALEPPSALSRGTRCAYTISTNSAQALIRYEVTKVVTFEGEGIMQNALVFPVRREGGTNAMPVTLSVEAVPRRPLKVVPHKLALPHSATPLKRRALVTVDAGTAFDPAKLLCRSGLEAVGITSQPSRSGKGAMIELVFSAESIAQLYRAGNSTFTVSYGAWTVEVPIVPGY